MMNCEQATRLMSEGQDRELGTGERTLLRVHTWMCSGCRQFQGQLGFLRQAVRGFAARGEDEGGDPGPGSPRTPPGTDTDTER
jgi:hypothetical protein